MRRAFTLVEILVVITVIAILVALLIPAVQAARAAVRRVQCANNHKQTALAVLHHADQGGRLPALGRLRRTRPEPTPDVNWRFPILPFLEEQAIYDALADGHWILREKRGPSGSDSESVYSAERPIDVAVFHCPSEEQSRSVNAAYELQGRLFRFDGLGRAANYARDLIGAYYGNEVTEAAWFGRKHWNIEFDSAAYRLGAKLTYFEDGLSNTILVQEIPLRWRRPP